jgi:cytochrome c oxidase subunit 3
MASEAQPPLSSGLKQPFHLVDPSPWPIVGAVSAGLMMFGMIELMHFKTKVFLVLGVLAILTTMFLWWRDVIRESRTPGIHSAITRLGLRYGMALFIASEVMFFVAFFWAYFHYALFPDHLSATRYAHPTWPPAGIHTFDPWHLPFLNTMILLLSGCTVTWAHHSLLEGKQKDLVKALAITVLLGLSFTAVQAYEYSVAPFKFTGGTYPSTFFLATGFHGFHVIVGTIFLAVCLFRAMKGHFQPNGSHFGFEAAAWYWHFVDVVWLFLFVCIYWWGAGVIAQH